MIPSHDPRPQQRPVAGWSGHERAVAWFRAFHLATRTADARLLELAQRELRALGVEIARVAQAHRP